MFLITNSALGSACLPRSSSSAPFLLQLFSSIPSLTLFSLPPPLDVTHLLKKVHQVCSPKRFVIKHPFSSPKGRAQHRAGPKKDCVSASCAVVITSRRISSLPQSTRVTGILILIGGLQLDVSFHLGIRHCCCGPEGLQPAAACRPFILRTDETSQRAVIQ